MGCQCSLKDGACLKVNGSGNSVALSLETILDPDPMNLWTCTPGGHLVELPDYIRTPPKCQAYNSSAISVPNNDGTVVSLNSERYDADPTGLFLHDTVTLNSRITFRTEGVYICTFNGSFAGNVTGDREAWIRKNGKEYLGKNAKPTPNATAIEAGLCVTIQEFFEVGEFIEGIVKQDSGGALNLLAMRYSPILAVRFRRRTPY